VSLLQNEKLNFGERQPATDRRQQPAALPPRASDYEEVGYNYEGLTEEQFVTIHILGVEKR
jgi:hypothetical protein